MNQASFDGTTYLYLVRHGATDANRQRPYVLQGRGIDHSLNAFGREQAAAVARFLGEFSIAGVYSSPMLRALETGQAIADHHNLTVQAIEGLEECDVGRWEGMDWDSVMRQHPQAYRAFMENPALHPYLGGESYADVHGRVQPIIEELLRSHLGESIALVAHNVVNRVYLAGLLGLDLQKAQDIRQSNACVNVIRHQDGETTLMTLNACFHLDASLR